MGIDDLGGIDRATLRVWRAGNLVGWGAAGGVVFGLPWVLGGMLGGRLSAGILLPLAVVGFVLLPYLAGGLVGDHVYRWPGWVAAGAVGGVQLVGTLVASPALDQWPSVAGVAFVSLLISTTTARYRWERRPRALRARSPR